MSTPSDQSPAMSGTSTGGGILPFSVEIPRTALDDLRARLTNTRWPDASPGPGWNRGVPVADLQRIAEHWRDRYDWRAWEAKLNAFPQFSTKIDGARVHFIHARSPEPNALPLVLSHGYPSSIVEFINLIGPLSNPAAFGGDAADAFHVVVPAIPGFGFSTRAPGPGWGLSDMARAWDVLMRRLGYDRYLAQGGDIGAGISGILPNAIAVHLSSDPTALALVGFPLPEDLPGLTEAEAAILQRMHHDNADGRGYLAIQTTRPQTLGYALNDSPVGQLAWIVEKFQDWTDRKLERLEDAVDLDQLLTSISLYWFTGSGASAANVLYDTAHLSDWTATGPPDLKVGWAVFGGGANIARRMMDPEHAVEHWSGFEVGGHFSAMEVPELLIEDMRAFFRQFR